MTLVGALNNAVQGLDTESRNLSIIADNISNSQTVGYKNTVARFESLVGGPNISPSKYQEAGVKLSPETLITQQGALQAQTSPTALAVNGNGFFAVTSGVNTTADTIASGATTGVTRAGDFTVNKYGYLTNSAGFYLLGIAPNADGTASSTTPTSLTGLTPVKAGAASSIVGTATTKIEISANLPATDQVGDASRQISLDIYDSAGNPYALTLNITKTAPNTWSIDSATATATDTTTNSLTATVATTPTTLAFSDTGQLSSPSSTVSPLTITLSNGETLNPSFLFNTSATGAGLTQDADVFAITSTSQNGSGAGQAGALFFDPGTGVLSQSYSNGTLVPISTLPVVTYTNPYGLESHTGNLYTATDTTGTVNIDIVNTNGAGAIRGGALESSTTDLAKQFTDLIISQTNYSTDSKVVNATNQMYQTVYTMKNS